MTGLRRGRILMSSRNRKYTPEQREHTRVKSRKRYVDRRYGRHARMNDHQRFRALIASSRSNAKRYGIKFEITADDFIVPAKCPVLGIPLRFVGPPFSPNLPSLDRVRPELGYVKGNVRVISWRANRLKADCVNPRELRAIARYIEKNLAERPAPPPTACRQLGFSFDVFA